ncbi:hypothetical protein LP123_02670 [Moraxella bovis]|uniref:Uncharacterized protein n=1 Tax=Moraxella bovis TaxID=476 RepID=A0AAQ2Q8X3_MORBO|nr:hypothetical protein [Moraxella bovis]UYZ75363.1 hypothetical protein LP093_11575 [Moraxella bovis]UYZ78704.1 hypothetical protein LP115_02280 [Moraxella bovis]UYZ81670.1 hypothetical protein LP113_02695 [Moraxella bovis]UYZ87186.1 hypothetical protein LP094_02280 [Moraxella bovis]UYZ89047.1 hypothetical protein LP114_11595 [Moraxella bovis]
MKVISLKTGQEIYGVIYKNNPSQIQEILNKPKVLQGGHATAKEAQKYAQPLLITFNLCYFQKSDMDNDENSYLFNKVPSNHCIVGVFNEIGDKNHIYILRNNNNDIIALNKNILEGEIRNITVRNFIENFLLIN